MRADSEGMEPLPLITVVITTYNYAHTVGVAIESALAQDYPELEVLVLDNCSTDGTPEVIERYRADLRLRYIRNERNIGMVPNHNKGLREARGEFVNFLSADDFLLPGHLTLSYRYLRDHPEIDVLYTSTYFCEEAGRFTGIRQMSGQPFGAYAGGRNEFAGLLMEGCYMCFPTMLMRRDLYERFGELDEAIKAADYEIVVRWAANGVRFAYLPEPTVGVRLHSAQQSSLENYVADAGDIREFVYILNKFAESFADRLRGWETGISRHMWGRFETARQAGVLDADGQLRATLMECDRMLTDIRVRNASVARTPRPTVIVLPGCPHISLMERTLRSLVAQTYSDWEAIVLQDSGQSLGPLGALLDPRGRIRAMRFIDVVSEGSAINTGLRVGAGDTFIVLRAGTTLPLDHFERALGPVASGAVNVVRTSAAVLIDDGSPVPTFERNVFMPPSEPRLPYIAPFGPPESLIFTRTAVDLAGRFNERLTGFTVWEFLLRAQMQMPVAAVHSPVLLYARAGSGDVYAQYAGLPSVVRAVHNAFKTEDMSVKIEREAYLRSLQGALERGPEASSTVAGIAQLLQAANGTDLLAGT